MKNEDIRRQNARLLLKEAGGNKQFAERIGKDPSYTSQIVGENAEGKDGRNIGPRMARHIEKCFSKPSGWLDSPHLGSQITNVVAASMGFTLKVIPLINYQQAGKMLEVLDPYAVGEGFGTVTTDADVSESAFALEIQGNSMEPVFQEGDRIVIDPAVTPRPGDFVVAKNSNEEATFKKYRPRGSIGPDGSAVFELVPLNSDYPTMRSDVDHMRIVGTMIEHRRYRRR